MVLGICGTLALPIFAHRVCVFALDQARLGCALLPPVFRFDLKRLLFGKDGPSLCRTYAILEGKRVSRRNVSPLGPFL